MIEQEVIMSASWHEGFDAGFNNTTDVDRIRCDPEYMEGAVEGALEYEKFSTSGLDYDEYFTRERLVSPPEILSLSSVTDPKPNSRRRVPALILGLSHIRGAIPDLSDLEGITGIEDGYSFQ